LILVVAWTGSTINGPGSATGYQRIGYVNVGGNNTGLGVFVRDATGTGDGCTIVNPNGGWLSAMSWVIEKASANSVGVVVNNNPGGGVNVPFPAVTFQPDVAGATDFLAIVAAQLVSAVTSITSYPAGYTQGRANFNVNGGNLAVAEKLCTAPGETPGNMVINTNDAWTTITITIANNDPSPARGVVSPIPGIYLSDDVLSPATASASLSINNQGLISVTGNGSLVNSPSRWYNPATSDIGNSFYYKLTVVSGTGPSSGNLTGVWLAPMFNNYLGWPASYSWTWTKATNGVNVATCRLDISTAGTDGTIVATETFNVLVNRDI
jgi:hypothetical protein